MRVSLTFIIYGLSLVVAFGQNVEVLYPFDYATAYQDVYVASNGRGFAVGTCDVLATTENGADWTVGQTPDASREFTLVACAPGTNCEDVWLGADGILFHSTDAGQNWSSMTIDGLFNPRDIHFLSASTLLISHSGNGFWRSTDGGQSWTEVVLPGSYRNSAEFVNPNLGYVLDQSNFNLLRSTDMGVSWDSLYHFTERPLFIDMIDANIGYVVVDNRKLIKTTNGGQDWTVVQESVNASPRIIVAFDEDNLMLSSFPSSLVLSSDGGQTWSNFPEPLEEDAYGLRLNNVHRNGDQLWIASDANTILYSNDRLQTRTNLFAADRESIESIQFANASTGYALCERRGFFKTTDGGNNWSRIETDFFTVSRDMLVRSATDLIIPYNSSGPQRSLDGGQTWSSVFPPDIQDTTYVFQIEELPGGRLYLMGSVHGAYSDDNGQNWNVIYHGLGGFSDMLYFYDDQLGFSGGQGGRLSRTVDGGETWTAISQGDLTNQPIRNIYMRDALHGFINISSSTYCTDDGGLTWSTQQCNGYNPPGEVLIAPNGDLFSTARSANTQSIWRSTDQGLTWNIIQTFCTRFHRFLSVTPDNRYLYGGWTGSMITRLDLNGITSTQEQALRPESLPVFPNPVQGQAQVQIPEVLHGQYLDLRLYNAHGQVVQQSQLRGQAQVALDMQSLANGFYFLELRASNFHGQAKVIKN